MNAILADKDADNGVIVMLVGDEAKAANVQYYTQFSVMNVLCSDHVGKRRV